MATALRPSACSLPRCLTSAAASTSAACLHGRAGPQQRRRQPPQGGAAGAWRRRRPGGAGGRAEQPRHVARITGKREEYDIEGITDPEDIWGEDAEPEFVEVDTIPFWSPERGPVEERVFREAEEEREIKAISIEDTAYWFADNGGDLPRTITLPAIPEDEPLTADEMLRCEDVEGFPPRFRLEELEEGDLLYGIVSDQWLWHGAFIDILSEYKGLVPIRQSQWPDVQDHLLPGTEVVVRVHRINDYPKYRFPVQLELLEPAELAPLVMAPGDYEVPANVGWCYDQGWDVKKVAANLGRHYEDSVGNLEPDHDDLQDKLHYAFGHDASDGSPYPGDWVTREVLNEPAMQDEVARAALEGASERQGGGGAPWGL